MNTDIQQHNQDKIKQSTDSVECLFRFINWKIEEATVESLTEAVESSDNAQRILESLIHKLQANRAELRYAIDELKRSTVKVG